MELSTRQQLALVASIVLAAATVISLVWGVWTYRRNTQAQTQLMALGIFQHYLDLAVAHPDLASPDNKQPSDPRYGWFAVQAGIVNLNFSLDELSPPSPHFRPFRVCFFGQNLGPCPTFMLNPEEITLQLLLS